MVSSSAGTNMRATMERPNQTLLLQQQQQQQQQQQPLRCPRCDSTNTKFCYYNNYSLSQPRHFCKSCKRYWTRGGTLRNVPVGGGCRKNKKVKQRQGAAALAGSDGGADQTASGSSVIPGNGMSSMFYGLQQQQPGGVEVNFPFSRSSSRFDLDQQDHQLGGLRLGFSSGILNGYSSATSSSKQMIQNLISSNSLLSSYNAYGSSSSSPSLLSSRPQLHDEQKPMAVSVGGGLNFGGLMMQMKQGNNEVLGGISMKDMKSEQGGEYHRVSDGIGGIQNQHHHHHQGEGQTTTLVGSSSADDQSLFWNGTSIGSWLDPSNNMGSSSISSLI